MNSRAIRFLDHGKVLGATKERTVHDLSKSDGWFMIKSWSEIELVASFGGAVGGAPGFGKFTVGSDRRKLAPVLSGALKCKLQTLLKSLNLQDYRILASSRFFFAFLLH